VNRVFEIREVPTADNISDVFSKIVTGFRVLNESWDAYRNSRWIDIVLRSGFCIYYIYGMFNVGGTYICYLLTYVYWPIRDLL
jgi:hypothetical protein